MYFEKSKAQINAEKSQLEFVCLDQLVPSDHILRKIEQTIDFDFIHTLTKDLYSHTAGRRCIDTVTLFKIVILSFLTGKNSIRSTLEDAKVNMAYRWFLNLSLTEEVPNYSTFSQNYIRRYQNSDVFDKIFKRILDSLIDNNLVDTSTIFVDGTHIKANANKKKYIKKEVNIAFTKFEKSLRKDIEEERKAMGRNDDDSFNTFTDENTGEIKELKETKQINISKVDSDSGMFVKGEHERVFAYVDQVACDKNGYVLGYDVNPANMHDSKAFLPFAENKLYSLNPKIICCDAGYADKCIAKNLNDNNIQLLVPYVAPKGNRNTFDIQFKFNLESDSFICPNGKLLYKNNVTKDGYMEYIIDSYECENCKYKKECLRNYKRKVIRRHIYQDVADMCKNYRLSSEGKQIYKLRKETIERVFAEGKEKHGLRYTRFRGLLKNVHIRSLLYACLNIKKVALYLSKRATNKVIICQG